MEGIPGERTAQALPWAPWSLQRTERVFCKELLRLPEKASFFHTPAFQEPWGNHVVRTQTSHRKSGEVTTKCRSRTVTYSHNWKRNIDIPAPITVILEKAFNAPGKNKDFCFISEAAMQGMKRPIIIGLKFLYTLKEFMSYFKCLHFQGRVNGSVS